VIVTSAPPRHRPPARLNAVVGAVLALLLWIAAAGAASACDGAASTTGERDTGQRVVAAALHEVGTPYAWGGGGPQGPSLGFCDGTNGYLQGVCMADHTVGFDCSGLALFAWYQGTGGSVLPPHYSVDQLATSRSVPLDRLIPGDLLFFAHPGGPVHHVGVYIGGGAMVHAEHTGTLVAVLPDVAHDPVWGPQLIAAARPGRP
jgi:cell wall-associated NlpC family hydrolase